MMPLQSGPGEFYSAWREPGRICGAEFVRVHRLRVKSLSGFVKGSHFIPQRRTQAADRFLRMISEEEIRRHAEEAALPLREAFSYGAFDYELGFDSAGAVFETELFVYRCDVSYDQDDLAYACLSERLTPARQWTREEWLALYNALGAFERLSLLLGEPMELREFASRVESGPVGSPGYPEIFYPASLEKVELLFPDGGSRFCFTGDKIDIYFGFADDPVEAPWGVLSGLLIF